MARVSTAFARIRRIDDELRAFVALARLDGADGHDAPLAGRTVAIKDVIDIAGLPTLAGSKARFDAGPAETDAAIVRLLRNAGATVIGKTKTTELATMDPTDTTNPYDPSRTPGGSSSGSAAAVGAGLVDLAVGTQTAGSLCRPAAYCGVAAFKPSYGALPTDGMLPLAPSFDTLGLMARRTDQVTAAMGALTFGAPARLKMRPRVAVPDRAWYPDADPALLAHLDDVRAALATFANCETVPAPFARMPIVVAHREIMAAEAFQAHGHTLETRAALMGPRIRQLLETGRNLAPARVEAARVIIDSARDEAWRGLARFDAVLTVPIPAAAPRTLASTGPADYLIPWTAFHGPLIVIPGRLDADSMPLATMLAARPGADASLAAIANALAPLVDQLPEAAPWATAKLTEVPAWT